MSQKIGSTFLKEFKDYEPPFFWKLTFRQTVLAIGLSLTIGFSYLAILVKLPDWMIYVIGGILLPPFVIYGTRREEGIMDRLMFRLTVKERPYQTQKRREYRRNEFIQKKNVNENEHF